MTQDSTCASEGCNKGSLIRGLCKYHYEKLRRVECGKQCSNHGCARPVMARGLCNACYQRRFPPKRAKHPVTCEHCGKTVYKERKRPARFCSPRCAQDYRAVRRAESTGPEWHQVTCVICSLPFWAGVWNCTTCSQECRRVLDSRRRGKARARRRSRYSAASVEDVDPRVVFESDSYRCHLCGRLTLRDKKVPHPKAPTIDHVVPLALGGRHEMANVRTACFLCNSRKGARGGGEQFALFHIT